MPSFRRPPRTLISGLGVAGGVLAAVVMAFAVASGFVAYSLTSVDPLPRSSGALVLDPLRTGAVAAKPLVLRPAPAVTPRRRAAANAGAARSGVASARVRHTVADGLSPRAGRRTIAGAEPQRAGDDAGRPAAPSQPAPDHPLQPVGGAIGATGQAVGATADSLANRLDTVTAAVGARTEPVATAVGAVADATTEALRTTVDRSGKVVGRLLGGTPQR
jgi:hypothetical protein